MEYLYSKQDDENYTKQGKSKHKEGRLLPPKEEIRNFQFWKAVRCEFLSTLLYTFLGCGSSLQWDNSLSHSDIKIGLGFGLAMATMVQCVGHISGAHLNPAITIAMVITRNISMLRTCMYILAQLLGAIAGIGILYGVTPHSVHDCLGCTILHKDVGLGQGFGVEFMITFMVVFAVFANTEPKRADMGSRSLSIGLAVLLGHLFGYRYTGASMNPARSLAPALISNTWNAHWVYWVGPVLGGIFGGFTYEYTHDSSKQLQRLKRSFRTQSKLARSRSTNSTLSTHSNASTELTATTPTHDLRV